jgi:O-antigen/teichoic acid export membrane protein
MPLALIRKLTRFATADGGSIKARVVRSGIWVGIAQAGVTILGALRSVVLARLLTAEMFGLMGIASIVVRTIESFTRPGIAQALIARQQSFEEARDTAFTMLFLRGLMLAALLAIAAPWIATFYEKPELTSMLLVLSSTFVIAGFRNINTIARERELDFRKLTYLSQSTAFIGVVVTIFVAWWLRSVWALVIGSVVSVTLDMLLSYWFVPGRPRFGFDRTIAAGLFKYGKFITGSSALSFIALELDSAAIGKVLGTEQLGYYVLAASIATLASVTLSKLASGIMMPAYSKLQTDVPALRRAFLRTLSLLMFAIAPATAGVIVVAEPLIHGVLGEAWLPAVVPLQLLALFGLFRALFVFSGYLFEGIGHPGVAFRLALLRLAIIVPLLFPMMNSLGLAGAASTVTIAAAAQWIVGLFLLRRHLQVSVVEVFTHIWRPLWSSAVMALVVLAVGFGISHWGDVYELFAMTVAGAVVYVGINWKPLMELRRERLS